MTAPVTALARPRSALAWLALAAGVLAAALPLFPLM